MELNQRLFLFRDFHSLVIWLNSILNASKIKSILFSEIFHYPLTAPKLYYFGFNFRFQEISFNRYFHRRYIINSELQYLLRKAGESTYIWWQEKGWAQITKSQRLQRMDVKVITFISADISWYENVVRGDRYLFVVRISTGTAWWKCWQRKTFPNRNIWPSFETS